MTKSVKEHRAHALDALRGYAIITMILSATEAFHILPSWMYHAQVPPPEHIFTPSIYGITWVDLIFPFFLFSMGAAIPLSLGRLYKKGICVYHLVWKCILRWLKLTFFAIFIFHFFPFNLGYEQEWLRYTVSIAAFGLLCLIYMDNPLQLSPKSRMMIKLSAYIFAILLLVFQPYKDDTIRLTDSDIIMLILANVALTSSLIYLFTMHRPLVRLSILPFIIAIFMASHTKGSWAAWLMGASPFPWLLKLSYQEYLLVILPGTIAGEWISEWLKNHSKKEPREYYRYTWLISILALTLIICNIILLFCRELITNLIITTILIGILGYLLKCTGKNFSYWRKLWQGGSYLLMLGLCLEAYEGGIRKDDVTMSYLFVTCGLAFFFLLFLSIIYAHYRIRWLLLSLENIGKNPMIAYVSSSMIVIPLLVLIHIYPFIENMSYHPLSGFLKGIILTSLSMALTAWFTHRKFFWKT